MPRGSCCAAMKPRCGWWSVDSYRGSYGHGFDSQDFVQSIWGSFFRRIKSSPTELEGTENLIGFLARAARNKVIDEYRRASSRKQDMRREESMWEGAEPRELADGSDTPIEVAEASEALNRLRDMLPEDRRTILDLKAEGRSTGEIAAQARYRRADREARDRGPAPPRGDRRSGSGRGDMMAQFDQNRTWEEAASPPNNTLVRRFSSDWRKGKASPPDPASYLPDDPAQRPAALLALFAPTWRCVARPASWLASSGIFAAFPSSRRTCWWRSSTRSTACGRRPARPLTHMNTTRGSRQSPPRSAS